MYIEQAGKVGTSLRVGPGRLRSGRLAEQLVSPFGV